MRRFVSVDLETTGLDPALDYIVEVGLAGTDYITNRYFEMEFSLPFPEDAMSAGAAEVNGWGKRQFPVMVEYDWAGAYLTSQLNDVHLVGKNPQFDAAFLKFFLAQCGLPFEQTPWHHRLVDVGCLAWGAYQRDTMFGTDESKAAILVPPNVEDVERMTGEPREKRDGFHTALCDARWAHTVFRQIVPEMED